MKSGTAIGFATALAALVAMAALAAPAWAAPGRGGGGAPDAAEHAATPAAKGPVKDKGTSGSGIVQQVSRRFVLVRELDASIVRVVVTPATAVFVNGVRATLSDVKPGFVVDFQGREGQPASVLRAVGTRKAPAGTVQSIGVGSLTVSGARDGTVRIVVGDRTRIRLDGSPATLAELRVGDIVVAGARSGNGRKPVHELRLRRPR